MARVLVLVAVVVAGCASTPPPTTVTGTLAVTAGPPPVVKPGERIDTLDEVQLQLHEDGVGTMLQRDLPLDGGQFEIDGLDPGTYQVQVTAWHHVELSGEAMWDEPLGYVESRTFDAGGAPVDVGQLALVWHQAP